MSDLENERHGDGRDQSCLTKCIEQHTFFSVSKRKGNKSQEKKVKQINEMWMSPRAVNALLELRRTVTLTINNFICE